MHTIRTISAMAENTETASPAQDPPKFVVIEYKDPETGAAIQRKVYVTEVNGIRALDLYSCWNPEKNEHMFPLETLPSRVCSLVTLQRLWLSHNKLTAIPPDICALTRLKELYLHCNLLESFPESVCKLPSLEILWLNSNQIKEIPDDVAMLKSVRRLHLDKNRIEHFPDALCEMRCLEVLYLNDNNMTSLSENIGNLKQLKRLYLHHNRITDLPASITELVNIVTLNLEHNEIRHVSREIQIFQSQRESKDCFVSISHNPGFVTSQKLKVTVSPRSTMKSRRYSDQFDPSKNYSDIRKPRTSLPDQGSQRKLSMQF